MREQLRLFKASRSKGLRWLAEVLERLAWVAVGTRNTHASGQAIQQTRPCGDGGTLP